MPNGKKLEGITDENGYTQLIKTVRPEEISLHLYNNEEINID
jgi:type VI secretion system secreted protein VgrG